MHFTLPHFFGRFIAFIFQAITLALSFQWQADAKKSSAKITAH